VKTKQELWDEVTRIASLQVQLGPNSAYKGFPAEDSICDRIMVLIEEMKEAGLEKKGVEGPYFTNWFFNFAGQVQSSPSARLVSICKYNNGKIEIRFG
jgi:hypothetical protein